MKHNQEDICCIKEVVELEIILFDIDVKMTECWRKDFAGVENVYIENMEFSKLMKSGKYSIDMVVSAANSFGIMDGALDLAYRNYYGMNLQEEVQKKIYELYLGEQPVGSSMVVDIPDHNGVKLCHTPTMRIPQPVDPRIVYTAMRSSLVAAYKEKAQVVLVPAFAHLTGMVKAEIVSNLMFRAYKDFLQCISGQDRISWEIVYRYKNIDETLSRIKETLHRGTTVGA